LLELTARSVGAPDGNVLVVREHVRRGTNPLVRSRLAELGLSNIGNVRRGHIDDNAFVESLLFVAHLVRIVRPTDLLDADGDLVRNEYSATHRDGAVEFQHHTWNVGEYLDVEVAPDETSVLWSTDVSISSLISTIERARDVAPDTPVDFEVDDNGEFPIAHESTWAELSRLALANNTRIYSVSVELPDYEVWWAASSPSRRGRFAAMAITFASPKLHSLVAGYIRETGTEDVRQRGPKVLSSVIS
jgi:hypothetical protein